MGDVTRGHILPREEYIPARSYGRARDYLAEYSPEQRRIFGNKDGRIDPESPEAVGFVNAFLHKVGHEDCLSGTISIRDINNLHSEIINSLSRNLALYMIHPQRYGHKSRNMIASALALLMRRIAKYRSGHHLPFRSIYQKSKKQFGEIVSWIDDHPLIWQCAEKWRDGYYRRVKGGYCDPL